MRNFLLLTILILGSLFALWLQQGLEKKPVSDDEAEDQLPDYFMENFTTVSLNEKGQIDYTLHASKMLHYDKKRFAELENPHLIYNDLDKIITVTATRAVFLERKKLLHLYDNVVIKRETTTETELSIYTDYMKANTRNRSFRTDKPVKIVTPEATMNSVGLVYKDKKGLLTLTSEVKGVYETAQ